VKLFLILSYDNDKLVKQKDFCGTTMCYTRENHRYDILKKKIKRDLDNVMQQREN
jgi:hypothetical protein